MKTIFLTLSLIIAAHSFAAIKTITTVGLTFSPDSAVIRLGDTVQFTNMAGHNAVEVSAATWNAGGTTPLTGGFSTVVSGNTITGLTIGLHYYVCTPHAGLGMKGRIWVLPKNGDLVDCSELYISEYIEGSGNNKAIELFNPGPSAKNLSGYSLVLYSNGSLVASATYNLAGTINPNATYVVSNSGAALTILSIANATNNTAINFNGNDAIALIKNNTILDVVGEIGENPGVYWVVGTTDSTKDEVLVRKPAFKKGNTNWINSAANEWIGYNKDTFSYLGNHTMNACIFPTIKFVKKTDTVSEGIGSANYQLSITNFSASTASSVQVVYSGGTGSAADHTYTTQTITFPANSGTNQNISIPIADDNIIESMETLDFSIRNASAGVAIGSDSVLTLSIRDNDTLKANFVGSLISGKEDIGNLGLPVKLSHLSPNPTTVTFGVKAGSPTATAGIDFALSPNTLIIPANDTTVKFYNVGIISDINIEGTETAQIEITNINNNGAIGTNSFINMNIEDDDTLRAIFVTNAVNYPESQGLASIAVKLTAFSPNPTSVSTNLPTGTATPLTDYTPVTTTLNFGANDTATKFFTANIIDDVLTEGNETVVLTMNATNGAITAGQVFTGTIVDNDNNPQLEFNSITSGVNENAGTHQFQVKLKNKSPNATAAAIQAFGGTASGSDYSINVGTVNFAANDSLPKTVSLNITNDIIVEGNETIQFRLINLTNNAFVGPDSIHTVTISDNDTLRAIFNTTVSSVNESAGKSRIGVSLNAFSSNPTTLSLNVPSGTALLGTDYTGDTISVTFAANDTATRYFTFNIINDTIVETNETFTYTINGNNGAITASQSHTTTIIDNDFAQFYFSTVNVNRQEGSGLQSFNVSISKAALTNSSVQVQLGVGSTATPTSDYTFSSQTLNFASGSTANQTFSVNLPDDINIEGNETLIIKLANATGGVSIGSDSIFTLTIQDNDTLKAKFRSILTNASETSGLVKIPVQLTAFSNSSTDVTIGVKATGTNTAVNVTDYAFVSNTITIGANDTSVYYFDLNIVNDIIAEGSETATFEISSVTNGGVGFGDEHVLNIADNDTLRVQFITNARSYNENAGSVQIGLKLNVFSLNATNVSASFVGGTATVLQDFTPSVINVVFNAMDTATKFFAATIIDDTLVEANETFSIGLNANNGAITAGQLFTGTIIDNEIIPRLSFVNANSVSSENNVTHNVQVKLNNPNNKPTNVTVQVIGGTMNSSDYIISNNTVSFAANDSVAKNLSITIVNDNLVEGTETLILKLINPTNNAVITIDSLHTLSLADNDTVKLSFNELSRTYNENAGTVKIGVKITNRINQNTSIDVVSKEGTALFSDFNYTKTTLTWAANDTSTKFVDVQIVDDKLDESNESFTLQLENQTAGTIINNSVFSFTITDNDTTTSKTTGLNSINTSVYPNPFIDNVTIRSEQTIKAISVYDLSGKVILVKETSSMTETIELGTLNSGVYLIEVQTDENTYRKMIEKK